MNIQLLLCGMMFVICGGDFYEQQNVLTFTVFIMQQAVIVLVMFTVRVHVLLRRLHFRINDDMIARGVLILRRIVQSMH